MPESEKRKQKTVWLPKPWLDWTEKYYRENRQELERLGVKSPTDLIWQAAELGKDDLEELVLHLRRRRLQREREGSE